MDSFVDADGDAYRCMIKNLVDGECIGNILDPNFRAFGEDTFCLEGDRCSGCDRDKVTISVPSVGLA
jgi:hypothetical protein